MISYHIISTLTHVLQSTKFSVNANKATAKNYVDFMKLSILAGMIVLLLAVAVVYSEM